jgi:hypothetical protein
LQLGALCGDPGDWEYTYSDLFTECGDGQGFDTIDQNATCISSATVSSFAGEPGIIPEVDIYTDYRWTVLSDICYMVKGDTRSSPVTPKIDKKALESATALLGPGRRAEA